MRLHARGSDAVGLLERRRSRRRRTVVSPSLGPTALEPPIPFGQDLPHKTAQAESNVPRRGIDHPLGLLLDLLRESLLVPPIRLRLLRHQLILFPTARNASRLLKRGLAESIRSDERI